MREIIGTLRNEMQLLSLEEQVPKDDIVRVIDAIVNIIDLKEIGYKEPPRKSEAGRPKYDPKKILKLYLYGYKKGIHSGEGLEELGKYDIRAQWLTEKSMPDRTTITNFRKDQKKMLKNVMYEINRKLIEMGAIEIGDISQDGFKIKASNSKEKNYTAGKILDRIERVEKELAQEKEQKEKYKKEKQKTPPKEQKEEKAKKIRKSEEKIKELEKRKKKHQRTFKKMQKQGKDQISLTDPDSKLMKNNGSYEMSYNIQTGVGVEDHITWVYEVGDNPADVGTMSSLMKKLKREYKKVKIIRNTTDKGYQSTSDMMKSLEMGVIPQVTPQDKEKEVIVLEEEYEENEISERELRSVTAKKIRKCLRAGKIPKCYEGIIEKIEKAEKRYYENGELEERGKEERKAEEIREEAIKKKSFEKDRNSNIVYCPQGERLTKKSINRKTGAVRYANKLACKNCKKPCTKREYREVMMKENQTTVYPKNAKKRRNGRKGTLSKKTVLKVYLRLDHQLLEKRMQTSEHSQGTMKTSGNLSRFNVRRKAMVSTEVSLYFSVSNIRRICNMKSVEEVVELLNHLANNQERKLSIFVNIENFGKNCLDKICQAIFSCYNRFKKVFLCTKLIFR